MISEHKKGFKAKKYPIHTKPATTNPVAKNSKMAGKAGEHKNPKDSITQPRLAKHKKTEVAEAHDPNFVGFMNKTLGNRVDSKPEQPKTGHDWYDNAPTMNMNNMPSYKHAFKFGMSIIQSMDAETKQHFAKADNDKLFSYLMKLARKKGFDPKYFVEEDMFEVTGLFSEIFHDPAMQDWEWADLLRSTLKDQGVAEGILAEDIMGLDTEFEPQQHADPEGDMARSELYRNAKYAMDLLKMIEPEDEIEPWVAANLTNAATWLDKVYHYLDYRGKFDPDMEMKKDDKGIKESDAEPSGDIARMNLQEIVEYSMKLFKMIKSETRLEGWVAMKLTKASEAVSSSKHYLEHQYFEKHSEDMYEHTLLKKFAKELSEAGYGRNRGYTPGFASPNAPSLGGYRRREDDEDHEGDRRREQDEKHGTWYIRIDGKVWRKNGQPVAFTGKQHAKNVAQKLHDKSRAEHGQSQLNIVLTMSPEDKA
jgi:hypothetical protein